MVRRALLIVCVLLSSHFSPASGQTENVLASSVNAFSFDFYRHMSAYSGNLVASPLSLSYALSMAYLGAREETARNMALVLHYPLQMSAQMVGEQFQQLFSLEAKVTQLTRASGIWLQRELPVLYDFQSQLQTIYKGSIQSVDFKNRQAAASQMNEWVSRQTKGAIPQFMDPHLLTPNTQFVLMNSLDFKAAWEYPFNPKLTTQELFQAEGGAVSVSMMRTQQLLPYVQEEGYAMVAIPYKMEEAKGAPFALLLVLPDEEKKLTFVEERLSPDWLEGALNKMSNKVVSLGVPRFRMDTRLYAKDLLKAMGMKEPFEPSADFSGISGKKNLILDFVITQAAMDVDELGTQASAASAVGGRVISSRVEEPVTSLIANRPFLIILFNIRSGAIVFIGRIINPNSE